MPSLKQIKRRITGITSTRQITRAMKMVAAATLRRAQENMERARPYSWKLREVIASLSAHSGADRHPLLMVHPERKVGVVTVTSDRGLCGSFNVNIARRTQQVLKDFSHLEVDLFTVGRKGHDFFRKRDVPINRYFPGVFQELEFSQAAAIGETIIDLYQAGGLDRLYLVYNEFKNPVQQRLVCEQLLPIEPQLEMTASWSPVDYIYEPDSADVLNRLLPMHVNMQLWRVLLESFAAEQGARMTAMENATENATELIDDLTLQYNKARQAVITKEILEIVGGAEGLK
ncbi:MAG: ATP synthase F1 subunit gamma [Candidatus Electryoneaceae bacterium]|nr:ATP synthase F1 subunit gamma [Candidatus Electryoneaceae bacterium]